MNELAQAAFQPLSYDAPQGTTVSNVESQGLTQLCSLQVFFERVDDGLLQGFMTAGSELAQTLDDSDRDELLLNVDTLQKRWKVSAGDLCGKTIIGTSAVEIFV